MLEMGLRAREAETAVLRELITFRVADQDFCVDATRVREVRGWTPVTLMPDSPPYVRGIMNLRGAILPIVDLAARLDLAPTEPTARHVVIVVWIGRRLVGLLVDAVCDILTVSGEALQPMPNVAAGAMDLVAALVTVEPHVYGLLALEGVLPPAEADAA